MRKLVGAALFCILAFSCLSVPAAYALDQELYRGYHEIIDGGNRTGIRIADGQGADGRDHIAYCYDVDASLPTRIDATYEGADGQPVDDRCFYSRIENYLGASDPYVNAYGPEKKQRIALALYVGYPNDAYGDFAQDFKDKVSEDEARVMTQYLLWDITHGSLGAYAPSANFSQNMCDYYNQLYETYFRDFKEGDEFFPAQPGIVGDMTMTKRDGVYKTAPLHFEGIRGAYCEVVLQATDSAMELHLSEDDSLVDDVTRLTSGEEFYISTPNAPDREVVALNWYAQSAKFYFYKHETGGVQSTKGTQNLIRVQPVEDSGIQYYWVRNGGSAEEYKDDMVKMHVEKAWDGAQPPADSSVRIWITADGDRWYYVELSEANRWQATVVLPERNSAGNKISYSVEEDPGSIPEGFNASVSGTMHDGFVVTNSKVMIGNNDVEFGEDTAPGESGSLPDGAVTETGEDSGDVEFGEDTAPGESGSLPDGAVTETEEDSAPQSSGGEPALKPAVPDVPAVPDQAQNPVPLPEPSSGSHSDASGFPLASDAEETREQHVLVQTGDDTPVAWWAASGLLLSGGGLLVLAGRKKRMGRAACGK